MAISVGQAAKITGLSKPTITRAIKSGKLSATRNDDGSYSIDASELERVYGRGAEAAVTGSELVEMPPPPPRPVSVDVASSLMRHAPHRDVNAPGTVAALRAEVEGLKAQLMLMRDHADELRHQRDLWQYQAQSAQRHLENRAPRRPWFNLKRAG